MPRYTVIVERTFEDIEADSEEEAVQIALDDLDADSCIVILEDE